MNHIVNKGAYPIGRFLFCAYAHPGVQVLINWAAPEEGSLIEFVMHIYGAPILYGLILLPQFYYLQEIHNQGLCEASQKKFGNRNYLMLFVMMYLALIVSSIFPNTENAPLLLSLLSIAFEAIMFYDTFYVVMTLEKIKKTHILVVISILRWLAQFI